MTSFRFLHAADIHLDSPLHGLARYEGLPAEEIRSASRTAFDGLVQRVLDEALDFAVIAGDLFDGDWRDMGTGLYFARAMGRLDRAGIPVFILAGNHDAASVISRSVPWPPNVRIFGTRRAETHRLPDLGVALHGQGFASPAVTDNLVPAYPPADPHVFNIGVLHTAMAGRAGHADYAPCTLDDLRAKHYDYWALGHVHAFEIVAEAPHVVYPGNLQGRTIRETGAKGAVIVTVTDREIVSVERIELDVLRWARLNVPCKPGADVTDLIRAGLGRLHADNASGRPLVARVTLVGETPDAGSLHDRAASLRDDVRAIAVAISPDLFVEKVIVAVTDPVRAPDGAEDGAHALLAGVADDPDLPDALEAELRGFMTAVGTLLGAAEEGEMRHLAATGDWGALQATAAAALRARLTAEG